MADGFVGPDARLDPGRGAWLVARATTGRDETVAAELERSADPGAGARRGRLPRPQPSPLDELGTAKPTLLRGQVTFRTRGANVGIPLLFDAAKRLEPLDAGPARAGRTDGAEARCAHTLAFCSWTAWRD
ncbi:MULTISPECIES: hypothetical protein [Streptomyces]|uniref:Uncharacterized protein n=2 Tax=Streptomyces TaxID=1883 RepID=A0ABV9J7H1_9ACTN